MKRLIACILLILTLVPLSACSKKTVYRNDVSLSALSAALEQYVDGSSLAAMEEGYLTRNMKLDTGLFQECLVKINAYGANIDEYGVFKVADESGAAAGVSAVEAYLQLRKDSWMEEYMPEEKPKLTQAAVKACGQYIVYVIVSDDVRQNMLTAFESALKS